MENEEENGWKSINDLLSKSGELNILEEEIDVNVQRQYMALLDRLLKNNPRFKELLDEVHGQTDKLFDDTTDEDEKKRLLVLLAMIDDVAVYRTIETFSKTDTPLKKWAVIALQQSRMLIQSTLLDESAVFVSTGLGGHGHQLRYFCVFIANEDVTLQAFQYDIIQKETELMIAQSKGSVEHFEHYDHYVTLTLLLPINANLKEIFMDIIDECNTYGNFLRENMIITNVKKLTVEEIDELLSQTETEE